jgi:hypothetical protein
VPKVQAKGGGQQEEQLAIVIAGANRCRPGDQQEERFIMSTRRSVDHLPTTLGSGRILTIPSPAARLNPNIMDLQFTIVTAS